jgi:Family of unknown function (DUF6491)
MKRALVLAPVLLAATLTSALADPARNCFPISQFNGWRAQDAKTIFLRVAQTRYYRLDLGYACPLLIQKRVHLITQTRGSDMVCGAADWDLRVSRETTGSLPSRCIVKTMTPLSQAEADAIPKDFKPQ